MTQEYNQWYCREVVTALWTLLYGLEEKNGYDTQRGLSIFLGKIWRGCQGAQWVLNETQPILKWYATTTVPLTVPPKKNINYSCYKGVYFTFRFIFDYVTFSYHIL